MRFAIVTPSYNKGRYLERCAASVLNQTHAELDYCVRDNHSTDGSPEILARLARDHPGRIQVAIESDQGQAAAVNRGFQCLQGDIMGWLNADDFYLPDTLSRVDRFFSDHPEVDLVYGNAELLDERGSIMGDFPTQPHNPAVLVSYDYISQPAAFWRRQLWERTGPLDEDLHWTMDWDFFLRASKRGRIARLPCTLAQVTMDGRTKSATGGLPKTREIARVSRRHGGWLQPTHLFCGYVLGLHWLAGPWLRSPRTTFPTRRMLHRCETYMVTFLFRCFNQQVMA